MMQDQDVKGPIEKSATGLKTHFLLAAVLCVLILTGLAIAGSVAQISGAVVATGTVVVDGNTKQVQHLQGGIVQAIKVKDGHPVKAGDLLVRLDDTVTQANLDIVRKQLMELRARIARLRAERDEGAAISFEGIANGIAPQWLEDWLDIKKSQNQLMVARRRSLDGRKQQLREQIDQLKSQIEGLDLQLAAKKQEIALLQSDIKANAGLQKKQLVTLSRLNGLKREKAELDGEHGALLSQIAQTKQAVSEKEIQILQIEEDARSEVLEQYQDVRSKIAQLEEQEISALDELRRVEIKAPRDGVVHQLNVHTIGAVISPGETIMVIVPREDDLIIEAQVDPTQIDRIKPEQSARIRLPSFDQRTTPELEATLETVSADLITDQATGLSFYKIRVAIGEDQTRKLEGKQLLPGMPAEVYLQTGYRSILSYLLKPLTDQIAHAMKER